MSDSDNSKLKELMHINPEDMTDKNNVDTDDDACDDFEADEYEPETEY